MSVIERAEQRLNDEIRQHELGLDNVDDIQYWAAYLDGARAQKKDAAAAIEEMEAQFPKRGEWVENDNGTYSCNRCGSWIPNEQHYYARYCLYCGAKMEDA